MNISSKAPALFPNSDERIKSIRQEVERATRAIEQAPAKDSYDTRDSRLLTAPQGEFSGGQIHRVAWMSAPDKVNATSQVGESSVRLSSETFKKDSSGLQAAAAGIGGLVGALLGGSSDDGKGGLIVGALLGSLAAWGGSKALEGPGEQRIERVETTPTGITTERVTISADGETSYTSSWNRIGAAPEFDAEAASKAIAELELG